MNPRTRALIQALFVTFLWSTSWVLIKIGLQDIPALTFAGLRYFLAFLVLIPFLNRSTPGIPLRALTRRDWLALIGLGLLYYTITQGTQFLGLAYLPAINFSLLLNSTAILVTVFAIPLLKEIPTILQWIGIGVFVLGALVFYAPQEIETGHIIGYVIAGLHILATSLSSIAGRAINRSGRIHPLTVTVVSMGVGSVVLLMTGLIIEPFPQLGWQEWLIILWLAIVNTAIAFTLWNQTLRTLTAIESSIINNTMLVQITLLAWIFLGERFSWIQGIGLVLAAAGALLVQIRRQEKPAKLEAN